MAKASKKKTAAGAHDHGRCVNRAISSAERACETQGKRLTPLRRRVLELIWDGHAPVKAYDLLRTLAQEHAGAAPATVYRALDFLQDAGLVHRINSQNAYLGCNASDHPHIGHFLLCSSCSNVIEFENDSLASLIDEQAKNQGFRADRQTVEVLGVCRNCQ